MVRLAKQKKAERKAGKVVASAAGPGGVLTSFQQGIQQLTDGTAASLTGELRTGNGVIRIAPKQEGFLLHMEDGQQVEAHIVVTAAPAFALAGMLEEMNPKAAELLREIPYAPMNVVCFGYARERIAHDLSGFGYLIPKAEGCNILGTLWDSSIFPNRAPAGQVLLRSMMGGATNVKAIEFSEEEVKARVMADLKQIMGITAEPDFVRIFRHTDAIPQYTRGHAARLLALGDALQGQADLLLTGNAFFGVGLNDCVHSSNQTAARVIEQVRKRQ
jgi:oxygen-dependent protoporphyrinogen oxidase